MKVNVRRCVRATKTLMDGIFKTKSCRRFLHVKSATAGTKNIVKLPLSCFDRTKDGKIILYRGLKDSYLTQADNIPYALSNAGSCGISISDVFKKSGVKKSKKGIIEIIRNFVSLTQGADPVLHTSTSKNIARQFAGECGSLIEYHIPAEYLSRKGYVSHLGENEISFLYSVPKKFVRRVTSFTPKIQKANSGMLPPPPSEISITGTGKLPPIPQEIPIIDAVKLPPIPPEICFA